MEDKSDPNPRRSLQHWMHEALDPESRGHDPPTILEELANLLTPTLFDWIDNKTGKKLALEEIESIIQNLLIRLWKLVKDGGFESKPESDGEAEARLRGWLGWAVLTEIRQFFRARGRDWRKGMMSEVPEDIATDGDLQRLDMEIDLEHHLGDLRPKDARGLVLLIEGYKYHEIAKLLDYKSPEAAKQALHRAQLQLRALYE